MNLKKLLLEFWGERKHRERKLNYVIAVSSGAPVTPEVPTLLHRRIGWATRQGANFVEVYAVSPAEIIMESEGMIYVASQLNLNYSFHPSESLGLDSSYRVNTRIGPGGFDIAQKFLREMTLAIGIFKKNLEEKTNGKHTVTSINIHAAIQTIPPADERLAADISVDPFGIDTRNLKESKIWNTKKFRERFWMGYIEKRITPGIAISLALNFAPNFFAELMANEMTNFLKERNLLEHFKERIGYREDMSKEEKLSIARRTGIYDDLAFFVYEKHKDKVNESVKKEFAKNIDVGLFMLENMRIEWFQDDVLMRESFIFREFLPRWMPHADEKEVREIWSKITGKGSTDPERAERELDRLLKEVRGEERMIAAVAGAYIWGHITQIKDFAPGIEKFKGKRVTVAEILSHFNLQITLEAHMAGGMGERLRMYAPEDILVVSEAINKTAGKEVTRITIDMEQISTLGIDPLWAIEGNKEQGFRGLKNGEGKFIRVVHVTHPYITGRGAGHEHGPIRRGDTQIFNYLYRMVEKGMGSNEKEPTIIMYEIGGEKAESIYMLRLIMDMIEHGIIPEDLTGVKMMEIVEKEKPETIREQLIQLFYGISRADFEHELTVIKEHALDPLRMLGSTKFEHTWTGRAAIQRGMAPEEYRSEEYR